jgi:serine/threonine protein kinase
MQVLRQEMFTTSADVYSFGVLIWEVLTEKVPFESMMPIRVAHEVAYNGLKPSVEDARDAKQSYHQIPQFPHKCDVLIDFLPECWQVDTLRPTMQHVLNRICDSQS